MLTLQFPSAFTSLCAQRLCSAIVALGLALAIGQAQLVAQTAVAESQAVAESPQAQRAENLPKGINDSFLDPNMKVEDFIQRFEIESREVFACRQQILAEVGLEPGMAVADVGSGTGLYLAAFSKAVGSQGKVYAVDIAPNFIKHLRQRAREENLQNVEVVLCSDRDVNLKPQSVDRVFICDVYHHFEYPGSSMASVHAALRDGGEVILIDFRRDVQGERGEWLQSHVRAPKEVFKQEIIDAGFTFEEEVKLDCFEENYMLRFSKAAKR